MRFTITRDHGFAGLKRGFVCGDAPDQFDQLHHWHRVHEMKAHEFLGPVRAAGQTGDGNRRGVGGQDRIRFQMRNQVLKDRLFDGLAFGRGLDDQIALAQIGQRLGGRDPAERVDFLGRGDLFAGNLTVDVLFDLFQHAGQGLCRNVVDQHIISGQSHHMRNPAAHLACAHNTDCLDVHSPPPAALVHHRVWVPPPARGGGISTIRLAFFH